MNCAYGETKVTTNAQYNICACTYRQVIYLSVRVRVRNMRYDLIYDELCKNTVNTMERFVYFQCYYNYLHPVHNNDSNNIIY